MAGQDVLVVGSDFKELPNQICVPLSVEVKLRLVDQDYGIDFLGKSTDQKESRNDLFLARAEPIEGETILGSIELLYSYIEATVRFRAKFANFPPGINFHKPVEF